MYGNFFKKIACLDRKIIAFKVKKNKFFALFEIGPSNFESSWLKSFALLRHEVLYIIIEN